MTIRRFAVALTGINLLLALGVLLGVLLHRRPAAAQAAAQGVSPVVRARAIELVDGRSQVRARLDVESDGQVVFRLMDARGTIRVKLGASEEGSGLVLLDASTEPGVHLLAKGTGTSLTLRQGEQRRVITP
jgi:hypothetical protein